MPIKPLLCLTEPVQVFQNKRAVCGDAPQRRASVHLRTVCTGIKVLFPNAVMYGTKLVAEGRFGAFNSAAGAVNHFWCDHHPVELCPQGGGFLAQDVVVCKRCDAGVTGFAVQSAAADQYVCVFHSDLHKLEFNEL